ncbi:variable surface protein Vir12-like [Plasmodium vivax]|uniref:Variable surface protein Vir12-like n=1 Tax=Plasmodium vivax (strain Salvador I) TaxID=126793 RepID=A5K697_PLAVS|nr:variable surface protein Vir12-like [Plasmodium vivax]EDL45432.1 variable surface protein Vir12-like [Plasmodium vivax]|eukprot:XP_001615159.1 variable surface protein Vir12-like [Plasmodium vivax Sal-1]
MAQQTSQQKLAFDKASEALKLNAIYEELFPKDVKSKFDKDCELLNTHEGIYKGVKALCSKFGSSLEYAADERHREKHKNYCNYLRYWLYDEIGKINKVDRSNKLSAIPFVEDLFTAVNKINGKLNANKCTLPFDKNVTLDDLIKRKILYIYFNKYTNIKSNIKPQNKDECSNYFTYLTYMKSLYDKYRRMHCPFIWSLSNESDFLRCSSAYDPKALLLKVQQCKPEETGRSSPSLWDIFFGSSPSRTPAKGRDTPAQEQGKVVVARKPADVESTKGKDVTSGPTTNKVLAAVESPPRGEQTSEVKRVESREISHNSQSNHMLLSGSDGRHSATTTGHVVLPEVATDSSDFIEKTYDVLKSEYFRHAIVGASIIGFTPIQSQTNKRERKERELENNYYDEYEEELPRYGLQQSFEESQMGDVYLSYEPRSRRDSYY